MQNIRKTFAKILFFTFSISPSLSLPPVHLNVNITKWPIDSTHHITHRHRICHNAHPNTILQCRIRARRIIIQCGSPRKRIPSLLKIQILPDPPCAIDLSMMEPESWIARRGKQVAGRVAAVSEVTGLFVTHY
jgi:hypothetical protein